jgi:hypothetical protein
MAPADAVAELSRERVLELEALFSDPDAVIDRQEDVDDWFACVDASKPAWPEAVTIDEGEEIPEPSETEAEWDRWYATPIADILFPKVVGRVHVPPRFDGTRPRGRRPRSRARARAPARPPDDDPPDLDLSALRAISPESFAHVLKAAGL